MPCGKLNTLAGFLSPTPSHLPQYTEKPAWQPGPTHSLRSYHTQQPGWSQYDRGQKRVVRAGPPQSETWHGCSFNMSVLPHSPLLPSHKPNARFKTCLQSAPCHPPFHRPRYFRSALPFLSTNSTLWLMLNISLFLLQVVHNSFIYLFFL